MTAGLEPFRRRLDSIDDEIARLLGERFETCREIARYKREHEIPMMQPDRVAEVRARYLARGAEADLPSDFTSALFELTIAATCRMEDELIDAVGPPAVRAGVTADERHPSAPAHPRTVRSRTAAHGRVRAIER